MPSCKNKVMQTVPTRYSAKQVEMSCGSTSIYGETLLCEECEKEVVEGRRARPGYCIHGTRLTDYDCDCFLCEFGEEEAII